MSEASRIKRLEAELRDELQRDDKLSNALFKRFVSVKLEIDQLKRERDEANEWRRRHRDDNAVTIQQRDDALAKLAASEKELLLLKSGDTVIEIDEQGKVHFPDEVTELRNKLAKAEAVRNNWRETILLEMQGVGWRSPTEWEELQMRHLDFRQKVGLALASARDLLGEFAAHGNCQCDKPNGVTCVVCEAAGWLKCEDHAKDYISRADAEADLKFQKRMEWLHSHPGQKDAEGYEWGVARVKFNANGQPESVLWTLSDCSDLDKEMEANP